MNRAVAENPVLGAAKEIESAFWADAREKELYFQHQRLLMDDYNDRHVFDYLLAEAKQEAEEKVAEAEEKVAQTEKKAAQAEEKAARAEEKAAQEKEKVTQAARNLLEKGFDVEMIMQTLGLSKEYIEKLR